MEHASTGGLTKKQIISFLQSHKPYLQKEFGITQIALFGSYARNEQIASSDIDLAIETSDISFQTRCKIKNFLEDIFKKKIDLCYFKGMRSFIRHSIDKELIYA
jgi:predicted nucleotidyltransferase